MNIRVLSAVVTFALLSFASCDDKKNSIKNIMSADASSADHSDDEADGIKNSTLSEKKTQILFMEPVHDFGTIRSNEMVTHTFRFKNSGDSPLLIMKAEASCGCTVPQWPKEPIGPGEEGVIEVKYNGSGNGQISKKVTITANTDPAETYLEIKANVRQIDQESKGPFKK